MQVKDLQLKRALRAALLVLLLNVVGMAKGDNVTIGDLTYYLNDNTLSATVTGHKDGTNATGSLVIPSSVTYTSNEYVNGEYVSVTRTYSVTYIGNEAFRNCTSFTGSLIIPNSVTGIGSDAFCNCSGFTGSLVIPNTVTGIGGGAFCNCSGFSVVNYNAVNLSATYTSLPFAGCGGNLIIGNNVEGIPDCLFAEANFTGDLEIPNSVTFIGRWAFSNCAHLTSIHYNASNCQSIGYNETLNNWDCAFGGNTSLQEIVIGDNVTQIPQYAFANHASQNCHLALGNSVETIGYGAFYNDGTDRLGLIGTLEIPISVTKIEGRAFFGCRGLTGELEIPNAVTKIGNNAFLQCSGFTGSLVIPNSVDTIGMGAFIDCSGFTDTLFIGTGVSYMDQSVFRRCSGFTEIIYNASNCLTAGDAEKPVFNELPNLRKIVIGENVEFLPNNLFANCYSTQFIRSNVEEPPTIGGPNAFFGINKEISVGVPCGTQEDYEEAAYWSEFTNYTESEYQLTVRSNPSYLGKAVIVQHPICNNSRCIVRARPERGCRFVNWTCNSEEVTQIISYAFDLNEDKVMVANFAPHKVFTGGGVGTFVWSNPSNWEPEGVPTDTMAVDIQANVIIDTDVSVGSVFNFSDKVLTVMPDVVLTVNQTLKTSNASGIVVEDGGQIVHHNEGALATVKKTVEAYDATKDNWNLISFPLADTGCVTSVTNMLSNDYDLYYYDEPTHYWINQEYAENGFDQLEAGKGYLYANSGCITYDFENGNLDGWTTIDADGDGHNWEYVSNDGFSHNGTGHIESASYINYVGPLTPDNYFVSPRVVFTPASEISFWACAKDNGYAAEHFSIAISLAGNNDASDFNTIQEWTMSAKSNRTIGSWYQYTVYLGDYEGLTGYVAIRHFDCTDMFYLIVDEITLSNVHSYVPLSFKGELEKGNAVVNIPLSYTETAGNLKGFNLVGNPFVHNVTSYGSTNVAEGCFRLNETKDNLIVSEVSETLPLKPAEGFFVKATDVGASITFNPGRSRGETERKGFVNLELREKGKLIDRLIVKREGEPLEKLTLKGNGTRLYALQDRQEIAIVPCEGNEQPFSFKASKNGKYAISVDADDMEFTYLHLIDNLTGNEVNLLLEPSYSFEAKTSDYASRFKLVFSANAEDGPSTGSGTFAFINSSGNLTIFGIEGEVTLQVVDVLGHVLSSEQFSGSYEKKLDVAPGVYMLRLINGDDVKTQKIVVR